MLLESRQWKGILSTVPSMPDAPAEFDFYRGMALAGLERWDEARQVLTRGWKKSPADKRFPLELAGVAFKSGCRAESRRLLKAALRIDPKDPYAKDFLATLLLLEGNLEGALSYWNRLGKPHVEEVKSTPVPKVNPILLDRAFAISRASQLTLKDLETTRVNIEHLGIFSQYRFRLVAEPDGAFDLAFESSERNGWGTSRTDGLFSTLRETPYQTLHFDLYNLRRAAWNFESSVRWDTQKQRVLASLSAPISGNPKWNFLLSIDGRKESWDISQSLQRSSAVPTAFPFKSVAVGARIRVAPNANWSWDVGLTISDRSFGIPEPADPTLAGIFAAGVSAKYHAGMWHRLFQNPEAHLQLDSYGSGGIGRVLGGSAGTFGNVRAGLRLNWLPPSTSEKLRISAGLHAGKSLGPVPFDEMVSLGLDRDNDFYFRGHDGLDHGKKGAGPLGRDFVLATLNADRSVFQGSFFRVGLGPFLDFGTATDSTGYFGLNTWQCDTGVALRFTILHMAELQFSYGWGLRAGASAFFSQITRPGPGS